ncbi:hypothetical protein ScPMuIL_014426 [Solemya velum]
MDTEEQKLFSASHRAMETGDILPLLKEELKYLIQSRRLSEGKDEMSVSFSVPPTVDELTPRDEERRNRRKEQNREAAKRFRAKKKRDYLNLSRLVFALEARNRTLREEVRCLAAERESLCHAFLMDVRGTISAPIGDG